MNKPVLILYLEDNPRDAELVRNELSRTGLTYEFQVANCRAEYEAALAATQFDLILSDFSLPDYDGLTALALARTNQPDVPFILISGTLAEEQGVDCLLSGATDYVLKHRLSRLVPAVLRALTEAAEHQKRRQAEAAMAKGETEFRAMFEMASIGMAQADPQTGQWVRVNPKMCAITGYTEAELLQMRITELTHLYDRQADSAAFQRVVRGEAPDYHMEKRYLRKDGAVVWVNVNMTVIRDAAGQPTRTMATIEDITAHKQAAIYQEMGLTVLQILNMADTVPDFIQRVLAVLKTQTGFAAAGLRLQDGEDFPYFVQEGFSKDFLRTENTLLAHERDGRVCRGKDGKVALECTCGLVLSGQTDPAYPFFTAGGSFWTNDSISILKIPPELDPRLHPRNQCIHHGYASVALVPIRNQERIIGLLQLNDRRKDCFTRETVELLEGIAVHIGAALQRKQTEEELRQAQRQVVEHEKLRALGQMASGIAHDFNNALSPIIGFSELLLAHPEKLADQQLVVKYLQHINTCGTDAARVVRQMREFGRQHVTAEDYRPLDLNKLIRQTIDHTEPRWRNQAQAAGRTIQIATDLFSVPPIVGEEFAIRELFTNLIFNAVDALPAGGTITLGTMLDGQHWVRLTVSDTGTGMTEEVRQRCLEPFFTTKGTEGTGLGLAMVQGIVQRHGGMMEVKSQLDHGTTIIIRLPIPPREKPPAVPPTVSASPRSLRVLVVDDEPQLRAVAEAWLIVDGHTVETVASGAAALAQLATGKFDLVITDKSMPEMNGEQLAAAIHHGVTGVPVILMTGFGDLMKAAGEMPPHISAILSKPITQVSIREALATVFPGK